MITRSIVLRDAERIGLTLVLSMGVLSESLGPIPRRAAEFRPAMVRPDEGPHGDSTGAVALPTTRHAVVQTSAPYGHPSLDVFQDSVGRGFRVVLS